MADVFNAKFFNNEVFGKYLETVPRIKQNAFLTAGIFRKRPDLKNMLREQTGGNFISLPMVGRIGGTPDNYDGNQNITTDSLGSFIQSMIVVGRAHGWTEKDFTTELTGKNFMEEIAKQVADYWDDVDQATILSILTGVFAMSGNNNFASKHTHDISGLTENTVDATTLNNAIQKAAGANKNIFTMAIMHSQVATNLENLELLQYRTQTDANGIQRKINLADWNGRTVLIDDDVPTTTDSTGTKYTTYLLGQGAFDYCDCGTKVPTEMVRDAMTNGGVDTLVSRQRKLFAPRGISFVMPSPAITSPDDTTLETGARWSLVKDTAGTGFINDKAIPIARIISMG